MISEVPSADRHAGRHCPATIGDQGGVRMTGGGFGGCVVALIPEDLVPAVRQAVAQRYEAKPAIKEQLYVCKPSQERDGAK